jgi:twitching motility protein PilT
MNASAYDLPADGELPPPPPPSYLNAPPPTVPPGGFAAYSSAPPPPPPAPEFSQPFDPSAFPPPGGYQPSARETYQAPDAPVPSAAFGGASADAPSYDAAFDPSAYAAPSFGAESYDTAFDPSAFAAPAPASAFDTSAFEPDSHQGVPIFDTGAFDTPAFDPAAFEPPVAPPVPPVYEAPIPVAEPVVAPAPVAVPVAEPVEAPAARVETPEPPAYPAPAAAPTYAPPAFTVAPPEPVDPVVAAAADAALTTRRAERERARQQASAPEPVSAAASSQAPAPAVLPETPVSSAPPLPVVEVGLGQEGSDPDLVAALNAVVQLRASDLHVGVNAVPMIRVDGGLRPIPGLEAWDAVKVMTALHSIMSPEHRDIFTNELELDFAYTLSETSRFRVNIYQQRNVLGAAFRLIPTEIKQLAALGIPERIGKFAQLPRGLVLVTGPTGSGKSTTLAALIDLVNSTRSDHIVTVEDPIEFMHENKKSLVNQREVGHDTHSFNNALKHVLRQDPDVILIGELRDLETISVALTAAETGHLVFATLHTQDAPQTIDRVIDVFPPHQQDQVRAQLAATLQGVVCQTLIKKAHGQGRAVATEVLITTPAVANLIREGKTYQIHSAMQAGREMGMHTMDQHLADLVNARQITHQAAYEKAHDLEDLKQLISRTGSEGASPDFSGQASEIDFDDSFSRKGA